MALAKDKITLTVAIDKNVKDLLEKYGQELDLTLSKLARNLILISLNDLNLLSKIGFLGACFSVRNFLESRPKSKKNIKLSSEPEDPVNISVILDKQTKELLDTYAEKFDIPVKRIARNAIYSALDDYKFLKKTGLMRIAFHFKNLVESQKKFEEFESGQN